jgi:hypothetical protein
MVVVMRRMTGLGQAIAATFNRQPWGKRPHAQRGSAADISLFNEKPRGQAE